MAGLSGPPAALPWLLGAAAAVASAGWLGLALLGARFRRSLGASAIGGAVVIGPVVLGAGLALAAAVPAARWLQHGAVLAATGLAFAALVGARRWPATAAFAVVHAAAWIWVWWARTGPG